MVKGSFPNFASNIKQISAKSTSASFKLSGNLWFSEDLRENRN